MKGGVSYGRYNVWASLPEIVCDYFGLSEAIIIMYTGWPSRSPGDGRMSPGGVVVECWVLVGCFVGYASAGAAWQTTVSRSLNRRYGQKCLNIDF